MKKIIVLISVVFVTGSMFAQKTDNALQGYFEEQGDKTLYHSFNFDGNGKMVGGMSNGQYFTRNDSLIVFPDKDVFIFKIKKNKLIGISNWVKDGVWIRKKNDNEVNNRKNPVASQKKAALLAGYYDKIKNITGFDALLSDDLLITSESFCNQGLAKACLNTFGLKMMKYTPGVLSGPEKVKEKKLKPHPELIQLSKRIISLGDTEGYNVLGSYYYLLGLREKAFAVWSEGEKHGDAASTLSKGLIDFGEEMDKEVKKSNNNNKKKK